MKKIFTKDFLENRQTRDWLFVITFIVSLVLALVIVIYYVSEERESAEQKKIDQEDRMYTIVAERLGMDSSSIMISNKGSDDSVSGQRVRYEINANGVLYTAEFNKDFSKITRLVENEKSGKQKE